VRIEVTVVSRLRFNVRVTPFDTTTVETDVVDRVLDVVGTRTTVQVYEEVDVGY
jgi:hypothetical protein